MGAQIDLVSKCTGRSQRYAGGNRLLHFFIATIDFIRRNEWGRALWNGRKMYIIGSQQQSVWLPLGISSPDSGHHYLSRRGEPQRPHMKHRIRITGARLCAMHSTLLGQRGSLGDRPGAVATSSSQRVQPASQRVQPASQPASQPAVTLSPAYCILVQSAGPT